MSLESSDAILSSGVRAVAALIVEGKREGKRPVKLLFVALLVRVASGEKESAPAKEKRVEERRFREGEGAAWEVFFRKRRWRK